MSNKTDKRSSWFSGGGSSKASKKIKSGKGPISKAIDPEVSQQLAKVDCMSEDDVNMQLAKMLDEMNVTNEGARQDILGRPLGDKQNLLKSYWLKDLQKSEGPTRPEDFLKELSQDIHSKDHLFHVSDKLRISLTNNGLGWVKKFGELGGLEVLLRILENCSASDNPSLKRVQHVVVRCLKAFMNNKYGLSTMLQSERGLITFVSAMDPKIEGLMADLLKVAAAVCLVSDGHERIMEAVTVYGENCECGRFEPIMETLKNTDNPALMEACMQFVNAILSVPDDVDFKVHLRNEFIRLGLEGQVPRFHNTLHPGLLLQLEVFENEKESDHEELLQRLHEIQLEFNDPIEIFKMVNAMVHETPSAHYFLSILQHMLMIRDDYFIRPQYYKLLDQCISQIVLRKGGLDPDFHYTRKIELDVEHLIEVMVDKAKLQDAESRAVEMEQRLQKEEQDRNKAEAELNSLQEKIQAVETQNSQLQGQFKQQLEKLQEDIQKSGGDPKALEAAIKAVNEIAIAAVPTVPVAPPPGDAPPPPPPPPGMGGAPPPPPPPPGGVPPPPLPGMGGPPGPPPPPGTSVLMKLPPGLKQKKKYKLDVQMKRMNWVKIQPNNLSDKTFWGKVNEEQYESQDLFSDLKKTFGTVRRGTNVDLAKPKFTPKPVKELKVLDPKSAQNISILLGQMRTSHEDIKKIILSVDDSRLSEQMLEQLLKFLPGPEQMNQLHDLKRIFSELSDAEQFGVVMCEIKRLHPRLECLSFRVRFQDELDELVPVVSAVVSACRELKMSTRFHKLLEIVLMMGNYMNAGSRNQQSYGFELNYLTKLSHTRASDQKTTLLHFLASTVESKYPDVLEFPKDLRNIEEAAKLSEEVVQKQMRVMETTLGKIESELQHHKKDSGDKFHEKMKEFLKHAQGEFTRLQEQHKLMNRVYNEVLGFFCIDRKKAAIDEFFGDLGTFIKDFERARQDNAKLKEQIERQKRLKEQRDLAKQAKQQNRSRKRLEITGDDDKEGVLDDLLASLQSGSAFDRGKRRVRKVKDEEKRPVLKSTGNRSRENSAAPMSPPREVEPTAVDLNGQSKVSPYTRALRRPSADNTAKEIVGRSTSSNGPSMAEELLSRVRKQNSSTGFNAPSTML